MRQSRSIYRIVKMTGVHVHTSGLDIRLLVSDEQYFQTVGEFDTTVLPSVRIGSGEFVVFVDYLGGRQRGCVYGC